MFVHWCQVKPNFYKYYTNPSSQMENITALLLKGEVKCYFACVKRNTHFTCVKGSPRFTHAKGSYLLRPCQCDKITVLVQKVAYRTVGTKLRFNELETFIMVLAVLLYM